MSEAAIARKEPAREVPESEIKRFRPRTHEYVLVIPVINEGDRIRRQLRAIYQLKPLVDVVLADGGSTDGSLDIDFLSANGCRAILTKKGPGKLGAQLRMAYAWALDEGYQGIITVDGNGKDGVEAIDAFVEKLQAGFDYIQGSRYIAGGHAINTPIDRKIGGRFIHAPLLSLFGRHWYTDTTNGFRGYSARYLSDPRVAPFRSVFGGYELLFYLTVRAGQLGYRVVEIPVTRAYPSGEKPPTKISGFRARLDIFRELVAAATGRFNPR
jgi:dolichol-phosphate mannosyltransferase